MVAQNTILVSMEVACLFTNIPKKEGITIICKAYETFYKNIPPIPTRYLRDMLRLISLMETTASKQIDGTAMGTKMIVSFANIFVAAVEREIIISRSAIWTRYIDDVFSLYVSKNEIKTFIELANNYHATIKFKAEISDLEITFADTCV